MQETVYTVSPVTPPGYAVCLYNKANTNPPGVWNLAPGELAVCWPPAQAVRMDLTRPRGPAPTQPLKTYSPTTTRAALPLISHSPAKLPPRASLGIVGYACLWGLRLTVIGDSLVTAAQARDLGRRKEEQRRGSAALLEEHRACRREEAGGARGAGVRKDTTLTNRGPR
jgi:hypothetical protein